MNTEDPVSVYAKEHFGINYLYPYQRLVIANVLDSINGNDILDQLVILPTGAGKSLCFQLPAGLCPGLSIIVFPLLGLMADQARRLESCGIKMVMLKGGLSKSEKRTAYDSISSGITKIVITNPETLKNPELKQLLSKTAVSHFVIDEAHCVAEWGDTFRPAYLDLGKIIEDIKPKMLTAFTATASPPILSRIARVIFGEKSYKLIAGIPDRPNIHYSVQKTLSLKHCIKECVLNAQKPAIVFVQSRSGAEILAEEIILAIPGIDCRFYHAGLEKAERENIENWFMASKIGVLCATCAYGMGMDKADIRTVIHYGQPASVEAYLQEAGRAGRDGSSSKAILIHKISNKPKLDKEASASTEESMTVARKNTMFIYASVNKGCRRDFLLKALGYTEADSLVCSGCDVCDRNADSSIALMKEIQYMVKKNPRRFNTRDLSFYFKYSYTAILKQEYDFSENWDYAEIEEAINTLIDTAHLYVHSSFIWKGRLCPAYSGSSISSSCDTSEVSLGLFDFIIFRFALILDALFSLFHGFATLRTKSHSTIKASKVTKTSQLFITLKASKSLSIIEKSVLTVPPEKPEQKLIYSEGRKL